MKFGIMSLDFKRLTLEETFQLAQSYGFDGVEIYGSRCHLHPMTLTKRWQKLSAPTRREPAWRSQCIRLWR